MSINHIVQINRSKFYPIIVDAIRKAGAAFPKDAIICNLGKPKAYSGDVDIVVSAGLDFETDWEYPDRTRFPHRIRAAATALRDANHYERFHVSHHDGTLTISKV